MTEIKAIEWVDGKVRLIDQAKLPLEEAYLETSDYQVVAAAIKTLQIRGAPAIGVAAAFGLALAALGSRAGSTDDLMEDLRHAREVLAKTRPTAINLFWALDRVMAKAQGNRSLSVGVVRKLVVEEAVEIDRENGQVNRTMGAIGQELIQDGDSIMTYCNAGALACGEYGTALGVVRAGWEAGKKVTVFSCETRPFLQGARLTTWELEKLGIPCVLIVDGAAGFHMAQGKVDKVILGADRIAVNGDTANKIGSYSLAVLAGAHKIPFYVVAPLSTVDFGIGSGAEIPIEERPADEVTTCAGRRSAPKSVSVSNPTFDVTPAALVTAIISEKGIARPPFEESLSKWRP